MPLHGRKQMFKNCHCLSLVLNPVPGWTDSAPTMVPVRKPYVKRLLPRQYAYTIEEG